MLIHLTFCVRLQMTDETTPSTKDIPKLIHKKVSCTSNLVQRTKFDWEIKDFGNIFFHPSTNCRELQSPTFVSCRGTTWKLNILIDNSNLDFNDEFTGNKLKIVISRESQTTRWSQFKLEFTPSNFLYMDDDDYDLQNRDWRKNRIFVYEPDKENAVFIELFSCHYDEADVTVTLNLEEESTPLHFVKEPNVTPRAEKELKDDLVSLLASGEGSDIKLIAGDKEFKVHRIILSSRCEVFKAMLASEMLEQATNSIRISDIDPEVVHEMLTFIYSGTTPNIGEENMAEKLLNAAEKYQLIQLKEICCSELIKCLNSDNAIDMLCKGHMYNGDSLKDACINEISKSLTAFMEREEWIEVEDQNDLYREVVRSCLDVPPNKRRRTS
ncbi:speckle-type POZ protein-like [Halichondria panicea]|uniref:speckle-type POZ protein-like n=1 Tax=Halichondria panicea TaxID=6063 RepID=UPI00312BC7D4